MKSINTTKIKTIQSTYELLNATKRIGWNEKRRYSNSLQIRFI
ncbi:hypothetical protein [Lutibacter sp.]|nr:hypothetical protein [Lutibacter sp.]MDP3312210.1 hypothetical protein [Lutibacter sp.]